MKWSVLAWLQRHPVAWRAPAAGPPGVKGQLQRWGGGTCWISGGQTVSQDDLVGQEAGPILVVFKVVDLGGPG